MPRARQCILAVATIVSVGLAIYGGCFSAPFVYDDHAMIVHNPSIRTLWPPWAPMLTTNRPIGFFSFAVSYALQGLDVRGFRAMNLAIHLAAAVVLFAIVRRTFSHSRRLRGRYAAASSGLALAVALIWMAHPLQTESVTYIYQRLESLMGLFYLLTLYTFIRAASSSRSGWWYAASVGCCALGMGTKEVMVTAPLAVLWYDRALVAHGWREIFDKRKWFYAALSGAWAVLAFLMWTQWSKYAEGGAIVVKNVSPVEYTFSQPGVILHYLWLSFWPADLCFDYTWPVARSASEIVPPLAGLGLLLGITLWCAVRRPAFGFVAGWFFLALAPTSSFAPLRDLAVEHRMYLPLAALTVLTVIGGYEAWQRIVSSAPARRAVPLAVLGAVVAALGLRTAARNEDYRTEVALWQDTVHKQPKNSRAHGNLAVALHGMHQFESAITSHNRAIDLAPEAAILYENRAATYLDAGDLDLALADYAKAIELKPDNAVFYNNRGLAYGQSGVYELAIADFNQAIELDPKLVEAYNNRAGGYFRLDRYDLAVADFTKAIELRPNDVELINQRALSFYFERRYDEAWTDVRKVRELGGQPSDQLVERLSEATGRSE